jgi:DNA-binding transcriptional MerR regulator
MHRYVPSPGYVKRGTMRLTTPAHGRGSPILPREAGRQACSTESGRASNGHRYYREDDFKRLTFIRRCRDFGFPIEEVRELVDLFEDGDRACLEVCDMAQARLNDVRAKLEEMRQLEASLASFVCSCDVACGGGLTRDCVIFDDLSLPDGGAPVKTGGACCTLPLVEQSTENTSITTINLKRPKHGHYRSDTHIRRHSW